MKKNIYIPLLGSCLITLLSHCTMLGVTPQSQVTLKYGVHHEIGRRPTMEDAHAVHVDKNESFFAIFDGHGGAKVAHYCAQNAYRNIKHAMGNTRKRLIKGFVKTDDLIAESDLQQVAQQSGSCAIAALIKNNWLSVANIGDSRAILSINGVAVALSDDHKPNRPDELERIKSRGSRIDFWGVPRIGGLAVSRAIGDLALRPLGVIPKAEIEERWLDRDAEFLILACDGIFEQKMSRQTAVDIVRNSLHNNRLSPDAEKIAAQDLVTAAYKKGSMDNLSAIVISFEHPVLVPTLRDTQELLTMVDHDIALLRQLHFLGCGNGYLAIFLLETILEKLQEDLRNASISLKQANKKAKRAVSHIALVERAIARHKFNDELFVLTQHGVVITLKEICKLLKHLVKS